MPPRSPHRLPAEPPPTVKQALHQRFAPRDRPALDAVFSLRMTAQQVENAVTEWMADTVGSPARFQLLAILWASETGGVPHKEIVLGLQVTRATVSGLMAALERDGLVKSAVDPNDRRNQIASLTPRGRELFEKATDANLKSLRAAFASLSAGELETLTSLLQRLRQGFNAVREKSGGKR